ncbi:alpha/beta hydrolase [Candidatus Micrarchaeota archaeon]|nr:alpha/beta hydrolase [Candidatus Micrarchaeota archaeon]
MKYKLLSAYLLVMKFLAFGSGNGAGQRKKPFKNKTIMRPDGVEVSYRYRRPETNNPNIAFQGGWTTHPAVYLAQIRDLASQYGVLTMENRGHWHSRLGNSTPNTYIDDLVEDFKAILDAEKIEKIVITGHSMWGAAAMHFYHKYPERVLGLVLVAPAYTDPRKLGFMKNYDFLHPISEKLASLAGHATGFDFVKRHVLSRTPLAWHALRFVLLVTFLKEAKNQEDVEKMIKNVYRADIKAMSMSMQALFLMNGNLREKAREIEVPVLIIGGKQDSLIHPESLEELADYVPNAKLEIWNEVAHFPMLTYPARFTHRVVQFLEDI